MAGDEDVFLYFKNIGNNKSVVCYAEGFDFPNGEDVLKKICSSIDTIQK